VLTSSDGRGWGSECTLPAKASRSILLLAPFPWRDSKRSWRSRSILSTNASTLASSALTPAGKYSGATNLPSMVNGLRITDRRPSRAPQSILTASEVAAKDKICKGDVHAITPAPNLDPSRCAVEFVAHVGYSFARVHGTGINFAKRVPAPVGLLSTSWRTLAAIRGFRSVRTCWRWRAGLVEK